MPMRTLVHLGLSWAMLVMLLRLPSIAQIPMALLQSAPPSQSVPSAPKDPRGRETPQSAVLNFVKYAQRGDYATAAKYLQFSTSKQSQQSEELARELLTLINSSFRGSIATLSNVPAGSGVDSDDPNVEIAGKFVVHGREIPFLLARVYRADTGPIWLVSSQTMEQLPGLYQQVGSPQLDRYFPAFLAETTFLGVPVGQWLLWLLSIPFSLFLAWVLVRVSERLWRMRTTGLVNRGVKKHVTRPLGLILAVLLNGTLVFFFIGMPIFYRVYYFRTLAILLTICTARLTVKIADQLYEHERTQSLGRISQSALQLLYRVNHAVILVLAAMLCLTLLGFDTKTMLEGLGIGGIALALGAQKTLENLIGGITLVADKAVSVGDDCVISDRIVTVRQIGLRSILTTTREGTEMRFPNGMLAQTNIENLSRQGKFLVATDLFLSYESSLAQLQIVVAKVRDMLYSHSRVLQETARFRLSGLAASGYQIELFAYVNSKDRAEFSAVQEDIFFRIVEIIESAGAPWAIPAQTTYLSHEQLVDEKKVAEAEETVEGWRSANQIPFPDFSPAHIAEVRGTLAYPPDRSVLQEGATEPQRSFKEAV